MGERAAYLQGGAGTWLARRAFLHAAAAGVLPAWVAACADPSGPGEQRHPSRLTARPHPPTQSREPGADWIDISGGRDAILYVPASYDVASPAPLLVTLHGRGGGATSWEALYDDCEARGMVMLAVESRGLSWDLALSGAFGADVGYIDAALAFTFDRCAVDPERIALAGFSDGASYALSLGPANGDLFTHLIAFSPGFSLVPGRVGWAKIWISHGKQDPVFDETHTFEEIVPPFRDAGYEVEYVAFEGGHEVPADIRAAALDWFLS